MMLLTASLMALFNMCRGNSTISHGQWLIIASCLILMAEPDLTRAALWLYIVVIVTIRATRPLLTGIWARKEAIWRGALRNAPIIPALWFLGSWWGLALLGQGLIYLLCGRLIKKDQTRWAEGFSGALLGVLI